LPINLSPEALEAKEKYESATTLDEKISTLQKYISAVPKHKGTEKLLHNLKKRLVKLKAERDRKKEIGKSSGGRSEYNIKKEGAGQVVMVGFTNSGKSQLFNALSSSEIAKVDTYGFTTSRPEIAMIKFEDIMIQLIELPAFYEGSSENREQFNTVRNCDLILFIIDLSRDPDYQMRTLIKEMNEVNIKFIYNKKDIKIEKTGMGGIVIINKGTRIDNERKDIVKLLQSYGIHNARVVINESIESITVLNEIIEDAIKVNRVFKDGIIVATKGDIIGSQENYEILFEKWKDKFPIIPVSAVKKIGIEDLKKLIFKKLNIIRVYTRESSKIISDRPVIIKKGGTVYDVAKKLGGNFLKEFKYAFLYRKKNNTDKKIGRRRIGLNYKLEDQDIIQIYT